MSDGLFFDGLDRVHIDGINARCVVGTRAIERVAPQDIVICLTLGLDLSRAGKSDSLADTVDYDSLKSRVLDHVARSSFQLIESLAESIAALCLSDALVQRARVRLDKPMAARGARGVAVEIFRRR